jgi:hypothetical protein
MKMLFTIGTAFLITAAALTTPASAEKAKRQTNHGMTNTRA